MRFLARSPLSRAAWERALIEAAFVRDAGSLQLTAILCRKASCRASIAVRRQEVPPRVHWSCPRCRSGGSLAARLDASERVRADAPLSTREGVPHICARMEPRAFQRFFQFELFENCGARALAAARPIEGAILVEGAAEELGALRRALGHLLRQSLERGTRMEIEGLLGALALARPPRAPSVEPASIRLDADTQVALAAAPGRRVYTLDCEWLHADPPQRQLLEIAGDMDFATLGRLIDERFGFTGKHRSLFACGPHLIAPRTVELPCDLQVAEDIAFGTCAPLPGGALRFTSGFRAPRLIAVHVRSVRSR